MYSNVCLMGLHNVASGGATSADLEAAKVARIETVKTMVGANPVEDVDRYRAALGADLLVIARLYIGGLGGRRVEGAQAARDWTPELQRYWDKGVRHYEIHNEPNLLQEGQWVNWQNGRDFATWWLSCAYILREKFTGIQLGFPGLSPGADVAGIRYDTNRFLREAKAALEAADWLGAHAYEVYNTTDLNAGGAWRYVRAAMPGKPLAITEFSSPNQSPAVQAVQYRKFYEAMRNEKNVFSAYSFCVYGDSFKHESWRTESGQLTAIPGEVAKRKFTAPPVPKEPSGIVWLPEPPPLVYVDDKYGGAIIRDYADKLYANVPSGTELARRSQPLTIVGRPRRVIVNRDLGLHVLADRIHERPSAAELDSPVGTVEERRSSAIPPGSWFDATGFATRYKDSADNVAYHTGTDYNLNLPLWDSDAGKPVYSIGPGVVRYAAKRSFAWGNIVVIEHDALSNGERPISRSAHLGTILVNVGERVARGQPIGTIGRPGGGPNHLHHDISLTGTLLRNPGDWPGLDLTRLKKDYVDPLKYIREHHQI